MQQTRAKTSPAMKTLPCTRDESCVCIQEPPVPIRSGILPPDGLSMMQKLIDLIVQGETKPALVVCIPGLVSSSVRGIGARIYLVACVPMSIRSPSLRHLILYGCSLMVIYTLSSLPFAR